MRPFAAALLLAALATGAPAWAARARAQAAFEQVPLATPPAQPHRAVWITAAVGAALVAASFPLADLADRRYAAYLGETDPRRIEDRWNASVRADRYASGALLGGEGLLVTAVWLRFLHHPAGGRVALQATPARCAVSLRF